MVADLSQKAGVLLLFFATAWIPSGLYYALQESGARQATLGKRILGLVTVRIDGTRVSFIRAATRYFVKVVVGIVAGWVCASAASLWEASPRPARLGDGDRRVASRRR